MALPWLIIRYGTSGAVSPPPPPPPPPPPAVAAPSPGGVGAVSAFRRYRKENFRSALAYYRKRLREEERQEELKQLETIEAAADYKVESARLETGLELLADSIEQLQAQKIQQSEIKRQIDELVRIAAEEADDEEVLLLLI